jgi:hypothetical protein
VYIGFIKAYIENVVLYTMQILNLNVSYQHNRSVVVHNRAVSTLAVVNKADQCLKHSCCLHSNSTIHSFCRGIGKRIHTDYNISSVNNKRTITTSSDINPVRVYHHPDKESRAIIAENKGQPGVYR